MSGVVDFLFYGWWIGLAVLLLLKLFDPRPAPVKRVPEYRIVWRAPYRDKAGIVRRLCVAQKRVTVLRFFRFWVLVSPAAIPWRDSEEGAKQDILADLDRDFPMYPAQTVPVYLTVVK